MWNFIRFSLFTFNTLSNIFLNMATNSSKHQRTDKSYKIKYKALNELEKGTTDKESQTRAPNNIFKCAQILAT